MHDKNWFINNLTVWQHNKYYFMKKLLLLLLLIGGGYAFYKYYLPKYGISGVMQAVQGVQTSIQHQNYKQFVPTNQNGSSSGSLSISASSLGSIQQQIAHLKVSEVASSSPQIQQILKQIQSLRADKVKATCMQICGKI